MQDSEVKRQFANDMASIYTRAKTEAGYTPSAYLEMLHRHGPLETARRLVSSPTPSSGYTRLWELNRLDLTVEALVLQPHYASLFDEELRAQARERLEQYGFKAEGDEDEPSSRPVPESAPSGEPLPPAPPPTERASVPAGWYPDPYGASRLRWWDGETWSDWTDENWGDRAGG